MKKLFSFLLLNFVVYVLQAQIQDPVKFKTELKSIRKRRLYLLQPLTRGGMYILLSLGTEDLFPPHSTSIANRGLNR